MCGITGFVSFEEAEADPGIIRRMSAAIKHRGPDDYGVYEDRCASLGHRRLSIVDLSPLGHQPMFNETRDLCIVFNGEIFNHQSLRPALERAGHRYAGKSDTETVLHAYEEYQEDCVKAFRGMFAFAIWNSRTRTLFCARDRMGIKPFYYYWDGRLFVFASEIKALLQHPAVSAQVDESQFAEYLTFGYLSGDRTLFAGVRKLMPGHVLTLTAAGLRLQPYWELPTGGSIAPRDDRSWIDECRMRLEETVRMRLMSDVPLGAFLSGGVDSCAITALMARMVPDRVKTFSVGYRESAYSELSYAAEAARAIGTDHHEVIVGRKEFFDALPKLIWHEDEPIAWPSSVSLYFVSKLAAERVKVVLTGEGADELFGGYSRYRHFTHNTKWMRCYRFVPPLIRRSAQAALETVPILSASVRRKMQHTLLAREPTLESFYVDNFYGAFNAGEVAQLLRREDAGMPYEEFKKHWHAAALATPLGRLLYADQKTYLVELLMKQDQMSMATSIESRVPFLDHPLVEFSASVPDRLKIHKGEGKYILKRAVEDLLPRHLVYRTKMGFPTPLRAWLSDSESHELLAPIADKTGFLSEFLDLNVVTAMLKRHAAGSIDATDRIWRLMNLQLWGDIFVRNPDSSLQHAVYDEDLVG